MGPEATARFFELIIKNTRASKDQDHIPLIIFSNPKIPPRTEAILRRGPSPLPLLLEGVEVLARAGADFAVIPCITAHYFFPRITTGAGIPLVSLLGETVAFTKKKYPKLRKAGLIASTGTVKSGLFHDAFAASGREVIVPGPEEQKQVMEAISGRKGVKAGFTTGFSRKTIIQVAHKLIERGAEAVIAGCTEVPLALKAADIRVPLLEPMEIAARACILKAGYKLKGQFY